MRRKFNKEMFDYLKLHGEEHILKDWQKIINKKFKENFTLKDVYTYFCRHNISYKYKNLKRSNTWNSLPIGTERTKSDGMVQIKVGPRKWVYKQRYIYEQYHNVKLPEDVFVIFLDQDRTNFNIDNLKAVSRHESSILSNQKIFSKDPKITELAIDVARLRIKEKEKEKELNGKVS